MKYFIKEILSKLLSNFPELIAYTYFRRNVLNSFLRYDYQSLMYILIVFISFKIKGKECELYDEYNERCNDILFKISDIKLDGKVDIQTIIKENKKIIKKQGFDDEWLKSKIDFVTTDLLNDNTNKDLIYEKIKNIYDEKLIYIINDRHYFNDIDALVDEIIEKY